MHTAARVGDERVTDSKRKMTLSFHVEMIGMIANEV